MCYFKVCFNGKDEYSIFNKEYSIFIFFAVFFYPTFFLIHTFLYLNIEC